MSSNVTDERDDFTLRCPRCQGYDFPGVMHVIGCPNDPGVESMSDPHTAVARLMKADETDDWCEQWEAWLRSGTNPLPLFSADKLTQLCLRHVIKAHMRRIESRG